MKAAIVYHNMGSIPFAVCFKHHDISFPSIVRCIQLHNELTSIYYSLIDRLCLAHNIAMNNGGGSLSSVNAFLNMNCGVDFKKS